MKARALLSHSLVSRDKDPRGVWGVYYFSGHSEAPNIPIFLDLSLNRPLISGGQS